MKVFSSSRLEPAIEEAVYAWTDLLSAGDYKQAFEMMDHNPDISLSVFEALIRNYGMLVPRDEKVTFFVTDYRVASGEPSNPEIEWYEPTGAGGKGPVFGDVHYNLPLCGKWSDLTAIFLIEKGPTEGTFVLNLENLHVM